MKIFLSLMILLFVNSCTLSNGRNISSTKEDKLKTHTYQRTIERAGER